MEQMEQGRSEEGSASGTATGGLTRRGGDPSPSTTRGVESARRFLYDEDEPPLGNPANTPLPPPSSAAGGIGSSTTGYQSRIGSVTRKPPVNPHRVNPITAAFLNTCQTCRGYGMKRLVLLMAAVALIILMVFGILALTKEHDHTSRVLDLQTALTNAGVSTKQALANPNSPQYHAVRWLANVDHNVANLNANDPKVISRYVLAVLFYSTSTSMDHIDPASGWKHQDNWLSDKGYCIWYGIACDSGTQYDGNGVVTTLNLTDNNVNGTIPVELFALSNLITLDLSSNWLGGTLPTEFATMKNLLNLILNNNQIQGSVPTIYGNFASLRQLNLGNNQIVGIIPKELEHIGTLKALGLNSNKLKGTIPDLTELDNLGTLVFPPSLLGMKPRKQKNKKSKLRSK